jgi:hypothetical protein
MYIKAKQNYYKLHKKQDESMEEYVMARNKQQKVNIVTKLGKQADQDTKAAEVFYINIVDY